MRGSRGRRRGRRKSKAARSKRSSASSSSSSKSSKSKSKRRSTAASKRKKVRSVAKAARAAKRAAKNSTSTSSSTSSSSKNKTKRKPKKLKLNKKDRQRQAQENAKKNFRKKNEQKKTISASQSRRQVRQKTKEKIATRKKITLRSIVNNLTRGAAAHASETNTKPKSKLQRQWANFQKRVKEMSTPEAKRERRMRRLYNQHGLDYSRMRDGLTIKANVGMALNREHKIPGTNIKIKVPKSWVKRIPQRIKNWKFNYTFKSPTKLGARDGWYRGKYNSTGKGRSVIGESLEGDDLTGIKPLVGEDGQYVGDTIITKTGSRKPPMGPQQDWLGELYRSHNIAGGKLDKGARDYWSNEAKTKGRDAAIQSIIGTSKAQGTYGGRKKPQRIDAGDGFPKAVPLPWFGARFANSGHGYPSKAERARRRKARKQNQAAQRQYQYDKKAYNLQAKGGKRRMMKSLAAQIAGIRGGVG